LLIVNFIYITSGIELSDDVINDLLQKEDSSDMLKTINKGLYSKCLIRQLKQKYLLRKMFLYYKQ